LAAAGSTLYFLADDGVAGSELWKSDGTALGTSMVLDLSPGPDSTLARHLVANETHVFFEAFVDGQWSVMASDGTASGTEVLMSDIAVDDLFATEDVLLYLSQSQLWGVVDGAATLLSDGQSVNDPTFVGDQLFFTAGGRQSAALWLTDGTSVGTRMVRAFGESSRPTSLANVAGTLLFAVGNQLWRSDGTELGTTLVKRFQSGPDEITNVAGTTFFLASESDADRDNLWRSDGTTAGTVRVADLPTASHPSNLTSVGGVLYFYADDAMLGDTLWQSIGTEAGTFPLSDLSFGSRTSSDFDFVVDLNGMAVFTRDDGISGRELWVNDRIAGRTSQLYDAAKGVGSAPTDLTVMDGLTFFATEGRLWNTDGAHVSLVKQLPDPSILFFPEFADFGRPVALTEVAGRLYFVREYNSGSSGGEMDAELWVTDGTEAGTRIVEPYFDRSFVGDESYPTYYVAGLGDKLIYQQDQVSTPEGLIVSSGLMKHDGFASTTLQTELSVGNLVSDGHSVWFNASDPVHGRELWKTDGTPEATMLVKDIHPGRAAALYDPTPTVTRDGVAVRAESQLVPFNDGLIFTADDGATGIELWWSDGTPDGTVLIRDINPGVETSDPDNFTPVGESMFFTAGDAEGPGLWKTDGTQAGTVKVKGGFKGFSRPGEDASFFSVDGLLYFTGHTDAGVELWRSDGSATGTFLVQDIQTGPGSSSPHAMVSFDERLYFVADDGIHGREVWQTDGTPSGTTLVIDVWPGPSGSNPSDLVSDGTALLFSADDGIHGQELWSLVPSLNDAATPLIGDIDGDGKVGFPDFVVLAGNYGKTSQGGIRAGDLNEDGRIDFADFVLLAIHFGTAREEGSAAMSINTTQGQSESRPGVRAECARLADEGFEEPSC
jgi:ELWxxDGT repeat protein